MIGKARSAEGATYAARLVTSRAVLPHLARAVGIMEANDEVVDAVSSTFTPLGPDREHLDVVLNGMYAAVNEPHGTTCRARMKKP